MPELQPRETSSGPLKSQLGRLQSDIRPPRGAGAEMKPLLESFQRMTPEMQTAVTETMNIIKETNSDKMQASIEKVVAMFDQFLESVRKNKTKSGYDALVVSFIKQVKALQRPN